MSNVLSVTYVFPTEAEATAKAASLQSQGFTVFVPSNNPGALPALTGETNQVLLDFSAVDPSFPRGGVQFTDIAGDGAIETIVAGVPDPTSTTSIKSLATKVYVLKDGVQRGRDLIQIETAGLIFDGYFVFVPSPAAGIPGTLPPVTGETAKIFLDATDVLRNVELPGVLDRSRPYQVKAQPGQSLWLVAARRVT